MSEAVSLQFSTGSQENAERFLREYVLEAIDRVQEMDACECFTFVPSQPLTGTRPAGLQVPPPDHPIVLTFRGGIEEIIHKERDRWDSLVEEGVVSGWAVKRSRDREEIVDQLGEQRAMLLARSSNLSAQMAKLAYDEFDDFGLVPAAIETYPDEESDGAPFGWWAVLHSTTVQLNYSLTEELDAYCYGIEHVLRNFAEFEGETEAEARLDELIDTLEAMRDSVKEGRLDS